MFYTVGTVGHQKLPREAVEYLSLEGLETETDGIIGSLLLLSLQWLGGWSRSLWSSLPTWVTLWSHSVTLININSSWLKVKKSRALKMKGISSGNNFFTAMEVKSALSSKVSNGKEKYVYAVSVWLHQDQMFSSLILAKAILLQLQYINSY